MRKTIIATIVVAAVFAVTRTDRMFAQRGQMPAIPNLAGKVVTVNGPIDPSAVGQTLMHEHIFIDFRAPEKVGSWVPLPRPPQPAPAAQTAQAAPTAPAGQQGQQGQAASTGSGQAGQAGRGGRQGAGGNTGGGGGGLLDYDVSLAEIMEFKRAGGGTIVDVTNFGLTRQPEWLKRISTASGLNVVMGAGWYQKAYHPPDMTEATVDQLADIIVRDIVVGAQGTNIKAGIIGEIGVQGNPLTENEEKSIRASARASRLTGAPMTFHRGGGTPEEKQRALDIVAEEGVDLNHVVMGHNGTGDVVQMKALTSRGAYIEFDYIGSAPQAPDDGASLKQAAQTRAQNIKTLIDAGMVDRILVAHDVCTQRQLKKNGGGGFWLQSDLVNPALKALGVSDADIKKIMVDNPRRALTFVAPQKPLPAKRAH